MSFQRAYACLLLPAALLLGCNTSATRATADRDNTAVNQRDRDGAAKTPIDQNENKADVQITASIRQRLQKEDVSINAKNVKIITQDGTVTLRGPVKTQAEKDLTAQIAQDVAGSLKVDNQLEVEERP
jgi:hyperosmotically inducible periplasmic protein